MGFLNTDLLLIFTGNIWFYSNYDLKLEFSLGFLRKLFEFAFDFRSLFEFDLNSIDQKGEIKY